MLKSLLRFSVEVYRLSCWSLVRSFRCLRRMQQQLEFVDCVAELFRSAEVSDDFVRIAPLANRRQFQHVRRCELEFSVGGALLDQVAQDFTGLGGGGEG